MLSTLDDRIRLNLQAVRSRIGRAATAVGRDPASVRLIAVSKTFPLEYLAAAAAAGQDLFGENRVQEAAAKIPGLPLPQLRWHLIGHLQSNKVRKAAGLFHCIQSVDSLELLMRLDTAADEAGRQIEILVQVDLAGETTKHGAPPGEVPRLFEAAAACRSIRPTGLMLLPPFSEDPEDARPYFRRLRELRDELRHTGVPADHLQHLSMGMSHDLEVAVQEGATLVRVGTAIFGGRAGSGA